MKPIIFWGASGHAKVLGEFIERAGFRLVAVFDNDREAKSPFASVPLYHGESGFREWKQSHRVSEPVFGLVAIGGSRGSARIQLQAFFEANGIQPATVVHPSSFVAGSATLGAGSQILAQAAVCADVIVGRACIINTASSVDHECKLAAGVHIGPGATLSGCVEVGENSFIGAGAIVLPRVKIGSNSIIGAGAVVTKDVADNKVMAGNPARFLRDNL